MHESPRYAVSVCRGSWALGAAGMPEGKPAGSHWLAPAGAVYPIATDGPYQEIGRSARRRATAKQRSAPMGSSA